MKTIEFLLPNKFVVLKIIQVIGPEWNRFIGYLPYLRELQPGRYNSTINDDLDKNLLDILKQSFPDSYLRFSEDILFKEQLEDNLKVLEGGTRKNIVIQFFPLLPFDRLPEFARQQFKAYPITFQLRLMLNEGNEKISQILDYFLCKMPFEELDEIVKTIKPV